MLNIPNPQLLIEPQICVRHSVFYILRGIKVTKTDKVPTLMKLTFYWEEQRVYTATRKTCRKLGDDKGQWGSGIRSHSTRRASNFKWVIREGFTEQLKKLGNASQTVS